MIKITKAVFPVATGITGRGKIDYLKATIQFALRHPEVSGDFHSYLSTLEV